MKIQRAALDDATTHGVLQPGQAAALWAFLSEREAHTPGFKPAHILYYLGGMTAIGAMTLFMTLAWESLGGGGLMGIALAYIVAAWLGAETLLHRKRQPLPAGILAGLAVALVPLAVYGAQRWFGWWPDDDSARTSYRAFHTHIDWRWLMMELATLAAGAAALWRLRLPFAVMPVAVTLWYLSMDIVPLLLGGASSSFFSEEGKRISTVFGLGMTALAFWVDLRAAQSQPSRPAAAAGGDFAFWLYIFGVLAFWGGLTAMDANSEIGKLVYALINLLLIAVGAALSRRVFAVFGAIGVALYLGHLSHTVFRDSLMFPLALTAIGLGVMAAGLAWQKREAAIGARLRSVLPAPLQALIAQRAGA